MADLEDFLVMYYPRTTEVQQAFGKCRAQMEANVPAQEVVASIDLAIEKIDSVRKAVRWYSPRNAEVEKIRQNYLDLHDAQIVVLNLARKGLTTKDEAISKQTMADFIQAIAKDLDPATTKATNSVERYAATLGLK